MPTLTREFQTRPIRLLLLAALFGFYFGSLWLGSLHFPHGYDWSRYVISRLLSPRDNPGWYWLPAAGVALAGLCMLPLAAWTEGALGDAASPLARRVRRPAFLIGICCLSLSAIIVPQHTHTVMGLRHAHELLARTSAVGLGLGMICACCSSALAGPERRLLRLLWRVATLLPILGAIGSGVIVALAHFHGVNPAAYFRGTIFWRLAFWEWAGSVAVFVFFAAPVLLLQDRREF